VTIPPPSDTSANHPAFPELRTPRFVLRQIIPADLPTVFAGLSNPQVIQHYGVSYDSLDATQRQMDWFEELFAQGTGIWWGICTPDARSTLIGACGFNDLVAVHRRAELGYWLLPPYWGKGIARECVTAIIAHAFDALGLHRVGAEVDVGNHRSAKLLESVGFRFEGVRRGCELKDGAFLDIEQYGRLSTDPSPV